jgi:FkbM family methyltransferase
MGFYWVENRPEMEVNNYASALDWRRIFVNRLAFYDINIVLDIGANSGQYASSLRHAHFDGRIISFEPLAGPFARLAQAAAKDPLWDCRRYALGDIDGTIAMNVAGNAGASSSVLPMLPSHQEVYPLASYVSTEDVEIHRLDTVAPEFLRTGDAVFLKADVQGLEKQVIAGGIDVITKYCVGVQIELSFVALYDGGLLIQEALELVESLGFVVAGMAPVLVDVRSGRVLQADGVFFRAAE